VVCRIGLRVGDGVPLANGELAEDPVDRGDEDAAAAARSCRLSSDWEIISRTKPLRAAPPWGAAASTGASLAASLSAPPLTDR